MTPAREPLTDAEQRALDAIRAHVEDHGYPPTVQELADACGYASKSTAADTLRRLERKGWLKVHRSPRAIKVLE